METKTRSVVPDVVHNDLPGTSYPTYYDSRYDDAANGHKENNSFKINIDFVDRPLANEVNKTYGNKTYKVNRDDSYVKANDINVLQDSIMALQRTIGCTAVGLDLSKTFTERFSNIYDFTRMDGSTAKGLSDNGVRYNTLDNRYIWGDNSPKTVTNLHSITKHIHNGVISPKIELGGSSHVQGTLDIARLNFSNSSNKNTFIHAGLLKYDSTGSITLHSEIQDKLDTKTDSTQTISGPVHFRERTRLNMMMEEDAAKALRGSKLTLVTNDLKSWSGTSVRIPANKNISDASGYFLYSYFLLRYGRYNSAWRMGISSISESTFEAYKDKKLFDLRAIKLTSNGTVVLGVEPITLRKLFGGVYNSNLISEYHTVYMDFTNEYIKDQTSKNIRLELNYVQYNIPFNIFVDSITAFPMGLSVYDE